jgi:hypothetical protein
MQYAGIVHGFHQLSMSTASCLTVERAVGISGAARGLSFGERPGVLEREFLIEGFDDQVSTAGVEEDVDFILEVQVVVAACDERVMSISDVTVSWFRHR